MKKLLFVNNNMHMGGVQRALVNLLWALGDEYDVTLLLFAPCGELMDSLPEHVRLIAPNSAYRYLGMRRSDARGSLADRVRRNGLAALTRTLGRKRAIRLCALGQARLDGYDAAISFLHDAGPRLFYGGCNDFVLRHVAAPLKIAFLHCDYQRVAQNPDNDALYARFDRIAACSEGCRESFARANPALAERTRVVRNCHRYAAIRAGAEARPADLPGDALNVLTVARLGREKGIERAVAALSGLRVPARYWVIGEGADRSGIEAAIRAHAMDARVRLLGEMDNPYGYMRAADLLLIPSYHEAAPLVIEEAACLGTPVLSTRTSSAEEQVARSGRGWVCENTQDGIAEALRALAEHPERLRAKRLELTRQRFDNAAALEEFRSMIEG